MRMGASGVCLWVRVSARTCQRERKRELANRSKMKITTGKKEVVRIN